ncbi:hypothetical protein [Chitinophaga sp. YR573]|uniref:hypothetical protein n=1 Tax=Chitinophaga sp. YR573 TaxID=1881040 RepID=UPI0015A4F947|nr:hypothetical protein [Chitinophaga sp. YR573]
MQKIDQKICEITGSSDPFNNYSLLCLEPVSSQKVFAEKTAAMLCQLRSTVVNFTTNIFPAEITAIRNDITTLNKAGFNYECPVLNIAQADSIAETLFKLANAICNVYSSQLDLSSVDWNNCSSAEPVPQTIQEGFNFLLDQICALTTGGQTLPTFDNTGTCLTAGTALDSLSDTITKIRARLCSLPTFSVSALTSSCINFSGVTSLEGTLSKIFEAIDLLTKNTIRQVDTDMFNISDADGTQPCLGKKISLSGQVAGSDRLVAVSAADSNPGTLEDKLEQGEGIILDTFTTSGKIIIKTSSQPEYKVKSTSSDAAAGFLDEKIIGSNGTINTAVSPNSGKLQISSSIDYDLLIDRLFDIMETDADIKARFCALVSSCPSPCAPPTNVQAIPA